MKMLWQRRALAAAVALVAAVGGVLVPGTAQAQQVSTGTLSFSGDTGDFITMGKSYSYAASKGDALDVVVQNGGLVRISVTGYNGDNWSLELYAPGSSPAGHSLSLAPGTYTNAHRYGANAGGPVLDLDGDGRGCNEVTGSFTVKQSVSDPSGYVQALDVTFEQHCEGKAAAARGEVVIANATLPATQPTSATPSAPRTSAAGAVAAHGSTAATPTNLSTASRAGFVMVGAVVTWVAISIGGLIAVGVLMTVRSRRSRRTPGPDLTVAGEEA